MKNLTSFCHSLLSHQLVEILTSTTQWPSNHMAKPISRGHPASGPSPGLGSWLDLYTCRNMYIFYVYIYIYTHILYTHTHTHTYIYTYIHLVLREITPQGGTIKYSETTPMCCPSCCSLLQTHPEVPNPPKITASG